MSEHVLTNEEAAELIALGVTAAELVRLRWPTATPEEADWILWERTPFPVVDGVHDIADAVADINETICGDLTWTGICHRRVSRFGSRCWQHNLTTAPSTTDPATQEAAHG